MWLRKGHFKRETESLQIAIKNDAIRANQIKARIDKTQQNTKCSLCGDRDKTIDQIISECSKEVVWDKTQLGEQEIWIWPYEHILYAQASVCPRDWHTQTLMGL